MFDPKELEIGSVFYSVKERNLAFHRKKIHREIDGQDWFRYEQPLMSYEIGTYKVLGILRKKLEGQWDRASSSYELEDEYYVQFQDETRVRHFIMDFCAYNDKEFSFDKDEILEKIKILEEKTREVERN